MAAVVFHHRCCSLAKARSHDEPSSHYGCLLVASAAIRLAASSSQFQGSSLTMPTVNRKLSRLPFTLNFLSSALKVDNVVTEASVAIEPAIAATAVNDAVALARAAAQAAKEAATLADMHSWEETVADFPTETDLLRLERARLTEIERIEAVHIWQHVDQRSLFNKPAELRNSPFEQYGEDTNLIHGRMVYPLDTYELGLQEIAGTSEMHASHPRKGEEVAARSKRRSERASRRERALAKAQNVASSAVTTATSTRHVRRRKPQLKSVTDPIRSFMNNNGLKRSKLLTAAEEVDLARGIQDLLSLEAVKASLEEQIGREVTMTEWARALGMKLGAFSSRVKKGQKCKDRMVQCNLRLVVSIAKNYQGKGISVQDLVQEGSMGLIRGCEKFDPDKGFKFSTYAHWWIRQAVTRAIAEHSRTVRLPVHLFEVVSRIGKARRMLSEKHGHPPQDDEVAELVGVSLERLRIINRATKSCRSMDTPLGKDKDYNLGELLADKSVEAPESIITKQLLKQDMNRVLSTLNPRERDVLRLRYGLEDGKTRTLEEIGCLYCITRERVRQIEAKAMRKLRQPERNKVLSEYLDVQF